MVLKKATKGEVSSLGKAWEMGTLSGKSVESKGQFQLDQVDGIVKTVETTTIQPWETKRISGMA